VGPPGLTGMAPLGKTKPWRGGVRWSKKSVKERNWMKGSPRLEKTYQEKQVE